MAKILQKLTSIILQILAVQILSSHAQSLSQYLQLAGLGHQPSPAPPASPAPCPPASYPGGSYGPPSYQPSYQANYQPAPRSNPPPSPHPAPVSAITSLAVSPPVVNANQKPPTVPKPTEIISPSGLDSNVLNNLAIALQLLIVSNILNTPSADTDLRTLSKDYPFELPNYESVPISSLALSYPQPIVSLPYSEAPRPQPQTFYSFEGQSLPNANFLGSSGLVEPAMFGSPAVKPNPRSSMTLMSPYEALGPNSPYSDPILSSVYSPSYSKKDFKSPYASILAADGHRDLFSVSDLF